MGRNFLALVPLLLLAGCATAPPTDVPRPAAAFPANALVTQRAILTARGREIALNGYLALDEARGRRLIVTELFGGVLADVLLKRDGAVYVMRSSRMLTPERIRRDVAADLACLLGDAPLAACPLRMLETNHFVLERRWYKLDVRIVETRPGTQPAELFDESRAEKP